MAKTFKTVEEALAHVAKEMLPALKQTAEVVKDVQAEKVKSEVYDAYGPNNGEPWEYDRRKSNGGLQDKRNMIVENEKVTGNSASVDIRNVTKGSQDNFEIADLVEYGDGFNGKEYQYKTNRSDDADKYLKARKFTEATVIQLKQTGQHVEKFKQEMKKRGIDVK